MRPSARIGKQILLKRDFVKGFTLVELLVVVLILAILMAVALPLYLAAISNAARRTARGNLHSIINAEQVFRLKFNRYTDDPSELTHPDTGVIDKWFVGPGSTQYTIYLSGALPDGPNRVVPPGGVAACAEDRQLGPSGDYGCFIPGQDTE